MKGANRWFQLSFLLTLLLLLVMPEVSHARLLCRSDPIVELSNGVTVSVGFYIDVPLEDVTYVNYEMHVPVGVGLKRAVKTSNWPNGLETFTLIADQPANTGYVNILVHTTHGNATVIGFGVSRQLGNTEFQVPGVEGQTIRISYDAAVASTGQSSPPAAPPPAGRGAPPPPPPTRR